jgi:peptidoglycan-associated lipoprotein
MKLALLLGAAAALTACHHEKAATTVARAPATPPPAASVTPPAQATTSTTPNVAVTGDLAAQCKLHLDAVNEAPKFNYDDFSLEPSDRQVLDQVATCLTRGPLAGRAIKLVGRADPRGTDEYNLGLGDRRANTVVNYLTRSGVKASQLVATTRGELDATGTDDATWQKDRRVDLELN